MNAYIYSGSEGFSKIQAKYQSPTKNQILVKVKYVGLNPVDFKLTSIPLVGRYYKGKVIARDFSGIVKEVGSNVTNFKIGDHVFGSAAGAMQSELLCDGSSCCKLSENDDLCAFAALPVAAVTSYQCLSTLCKGKTVLIIGASGGCGSIGIQIAKSLGAKVTAICSAKNSAYVKSLGADEVVEYDKVKMFEVLPTSNFDLIYDTVSSPEDISYDTEETMSLLTDSGRYIMINSPRRLDWIRSIFSDYIFDIEREKHHLHLAKIDSSSLGIIRDMVYKGNIDISSLPIDTQFSFDDVPAAYDLLKARRVVGKIVIEMIK